MPVAYCIIYHGYGLRGMAEVGLTAAGSQFQLWPASAAEYAADRFAM